MRGTSKSARWSQAGRQSVRTLPSGRATKTQAPHLRPCKHTLTLWAYVQLAMGAHAAFTQQIRCLESSCSWVINKTAATWNLPDIITNAMKRSTKEHTRLTQTYPIGSAPCTTLAVVTQMSMPPPTHTAGTPIRPAPT
eukprot:232503-Chlamydomonas_euryale.AAC.2